MTWNFCLFIAPKLSLFCIFESTAPPTSDRCCSDTSPADLLLEKYKYAVCIFPYIYIHYIYTYIHIPYIHSHFYTNWLGSPFETKFSHTNWVIHLGNGNLSLYCFRVVYICIHIYKPGCVCVLWRVSLFWNTKQKRYCTIVFLPARSTLLVCHGVLTNLVKRLRRMGRLRLTFSHSAKVIDLGVLG